MKTILPRDFAAEGPGVPAIVMPQDAVAVVDLFDLQGCGLASPTRFVAVDGKGTLGLLPSEARTELAPEVQESLAANGLRRRGREVEAERIFLLAAESLELGAERPGPDDPVRLRGVLHGPFPDSNPMAVAGQLTVTLPELLSALVCSAPQATHLEWTGEPLARSCFHALVPADEIDAVLAGSGLVLVYPVDKKNGLQAGNEELVAEWLQRMLQAFRADLLSRNAKADWLDSPLPVTNRAPLEASLLAQGYELKKDEAVRRREGIAGLFLRDTVPLPAVGGAFEFLAVARQALSSLPGGPGERARAAMDRTRSWEVSWTPEAPDGLTPLPWSDGNFRVKSGTLHSEWGTKNAAYLYLRLDRRLVVDGGDLELELEIEGSYGQVGCEHSVIGGGDYAPSVTPPVSLEGPSGWRILRFQLEQAEIRGAQNGGADLRLFVFNGEFELRRIALRAAPVRIAIAEIEVSEAGAFLFRGHGTHLCPANTLNAAPRSKLCLREDGRPLGPAHASHADIAALGDGRYIHWSGTGDAAPVLYFSSSDGTDPRTNDRVYTLLVKRQDAPRRS